MMRYQRVCLPRKTSTISTTFTPPPQTIKPRSGSGSANPLTTQTHHEPSENNNSSNKNHEISKELVLQWGHQDPFDNHNSSNNNHEISKELILQWGHKKRSRGSRAAENPNHDNNRTAGDEPSARQMIKIQRRAAIVGAEKIAAVAAAMPPPAFCSTRGANLRGCTTATTTHHIRNVEERSGGQSRSEKRSPSQPNKPHNNHQHHKKPGANGFRSDAAVSSMNQDTKAHHPSDQENLSPAAAEKLNLGQFEWPRIYLSLSRKEKEDDFLAMKGTKLSQRPKKRAKNIDKTLQYCFPGMWLSDLTRSRYEVREKKCVKKKRRGLKGMESMDSDSE